MDLSYDKDEITANLNAFASSLGLDEKTVEKITDITKKEADDSMKRALETIGSSPIAIDASATPRPIGLALLLTEYGFNVKRVYTDAFNKKERNAFEKLCKLNPDIEIYPSMDPLMLNADLETKIGESEYLCIGQKSAYFCQTGKFVNIIEGGGMYGFDGIRHLGEMMTDAFLNEKDLKLTISYKGLECESCL